MKTTIEITDCTDCPFAKKHVGHEECWTECSHEENNRGAYEDILWGCQGFFQRVPNWCPIFGNPNTTEVEPELPTFLNPQDCDHSERTHISNENMRGFTCRKCNGWFAYDTKEYRDHYPPVYPKENNP